MHARPRNSSSLDHRRTCTTYLPAMSAYNRTCKMLALLSLLLAFSIAQDDQKLIKVAAAQHHHTSDQFIIRSDFPTITTNATDGAGSLISEGTQFHNQFHEPHQSKSATHNRQAVPSTCTDGLLTFELSTGCIYKPSSAETLAMMPSTLQLTDCLDYCLHNDSCLAINFEVGLCVLLSSSAKQNPSNLYTSQFPVFTIYAEKKCLLAGKLSEHKTHPPKNVSLFLQYDFDRFKVPPMVAQLEAPVLFACDRPKNLTHRQVETLSRLTGNPDRQVEL